MNAVLTTNRRDDVFVMERFSEEQLDDERKRVLADMLWFWRSSQPGRISQQEAARRLGVSHRSYQQYERGEVLPRPQTIGLILEGINVSWAEWQKRVYGPMVADAVSESRTRMEDRLAEIQKQIDALSSERHLESDEDD